MARPDFYEDNVRFSQAFRRHHDLKNVAQVKLARWTELSKKIEETEGSDSP